MPTIDVFHNNKDQIALGKEDALFWQLLKRSIGSLQECRLVS